MILRILHSIGIFLYVALVFLAMCAAIVAMGCSQQRDGWLDWWRSDQSIPAPSMGEPMDAPTTATLPYLTLVWTPPDTTITDWPDLGPLPEPVPMTWDVERFESILEGENE